MKRNTKIIVWTIVAIILLIGCVIGVLAYINSSFEETRIYPDDSRKRPADTTFVVNGIELKMIGVNGGKIKCKGLNRTIELKDFYIGETEVTQELWMSVMGVNPSVHKDSLLCPVEDMDLVECLKFVHKLDSITGYDFNVQSYPEWLYVSHLGTIDEYSPHNTLDSMAWYKKNSGNAAHPVKQKRPNALGVYDMIGNVAEWTISGSDPLFFVMGGSYESEEERCVPDVREVNHASIKTGSVGLRLVYYPKVEKE